MRSLESFVETLFGSDYQELFEVIDGVVRKPDIEWIEDFILRAYNED